MRVGICEWLGFVSGWDLGGGLWGWWWRFLGVFCGVELLNLKKNDLI